LRVSRHVQGLLRKRQHTLLLFGLFPGRQIRFQPGGYAHHQATKGFQMTVPPAIICRVGCRFDRHYAPQLTLCQVYKNGFSQAVQHRRP
jgi:hypothetical protein